MTIEQRLVAALSHVDQVEPSPDLWSRVVHSIEEDRRHRRRVLLTGASVVVAAAVLLAVGAANLADGEFGRYVHRPTMAVLELAALVCLTLALAPAIRRFGRGYVDDLWPARGVMAKALLRLVDVAYHLVFAGYILVTTRFEFQPSGRDGLLADQVQGALGRIGGLLLIMGLLHAVTMMALPLIALVDNSTRAGRPLPRWVVALLAAAGAGIVLLVLPNAIGLLAGSA